MIARAATLVALMMLGMASPAASAPFSPGADLLSADFARGTQGDDATTQVALARGGRYAVFVTRASNLFASDDSGPGGVTRAGGVFRVDLQTRALELVADGDLVDAQTRELRRLGARVAAVSDDGRHVAFSTNEQLVAADVNDNTDVYVRDMTGPLRDPASYTLVSARDGSDVPLSYAPRDPPLPGRNPGADISATPAISGDGTRVAFRTVETASDVPGRPRPDTPAGQVVVRDIVARSTTVITRTREGGEPAGGAVGPVVISRDGSTVAWVGANASLQTRFLTGEQTDPFVLYYLWHRVDDGPAARTRRVTGLADPDDPACPADGVVGTDPTASGPCYGPLTDVEQGRSDIRQRPPSLSDDGQTVAFLASAARRPASVTNPGLDLFVTSMAPGVRRKDTIELTREGAPDDVAQAAPLEGIAMTGSGDGVYLVTGRTRFVIPALTPLGAFRKVPGERELYFADLRARTIERVVTGFGGDDPTVGVQAGVSPSGEGDAVAFVSGSGNLFFGDGNDRADAFVAVRPREAAFMAPAPQDLGAADGTSPTETLPPATRPAVRIQKLGDGRLRLRIAVAGRGVVRVAARAGRPARVVARAVRRAVRAGTVVITVRPDARVRRSLRARRRVATRLTVSFSPLRLGSSTASVVRDSAFTVSPKSARRAIR